MLTVIERVRVYFSLSFFDGCYLPEMCMRRVILPLSMLQVLFHPECRVIDHYNACRGIQTLANKITGLSGTINQRYTREVERYDAAFPSQDCLAILMLVHLEHSHFMSIAVSH